MKPAAYQELDRYERKWLVDEVNYHFDVEINEAILAFIEDETIVRILNYIESYIGGNKTALGKLRRHYPR